MVQDASLSWLYLQAMDYLKRGISICAACGDKTRQHFTMFDKEVPCKSCSMDDKVLSRIREHGDGEEAINPKWRRWTPCKGYVRFDPLVHSSLDNSYERHKRISELEKTYGFKL